MNCPNCGNELPTSVSLACPACGRALSGATDAPPIMDTTKPRSHWLLFFGLLLGPALLTALLAMGGRDAEGMAIGVALLGGGAGGIVAGGLLGRRLGRTVQAKVILGVALAGVMAVVCVGMCCFGCLAGGFKLSFR